MAFYLIEKLKRKYITKTECSLAGNVLQIGLVKLRLMSNRIKINFETINKGKYEIIPPKEIAESNARIKKAMKEFIRKLKRK